MRNIVIFADYGLDDAAATVSIFKSAEKFESIVLIPIGGNVPANIAYRNCHTLVSNFKQLLDKITVVNTCHLKQPNEYLATIHGNDGMGDFFTHPEEKTQVNELFFEDWLNNYYSGNEVVLSLGPATLVKETLIKKAPKELVIMGGCVKEKPNFNGREFNHALDVEAFAFCLKFPHTAITLDTCRIKKLDMRQYEITGEDIHSKILIADQKLSITRKEEGCYVWDDIAANFVLFPERFTVSEEIDIDGNKINQAKYISEKLYYMP